MEMLPRVKVAPRLYVVEGRPESFTPALNRPRVALAWKELRTGESLETISYVLLLLSGWGGIGLCLL
jgi:hypothetical protein